MLACVSDLHPWTESPKSGDVTSFRSSPILGVCLTALALSAVAQAQTRPNRFEVGGSVVFTRQSDFNPDNELIRRGEYGEEKLSLPSWWELGPGVRFSIHITDRFGVEAEARLATGSAHNVGPQFHGGAKAQAGAGLRYGVRLRRAGIFGKAQVGGAELTRAPAIVGRSSSTADAILIAVGEQDATFPYFSIGGVIEALHHGPTKLRMDVEDQMMFYAPQPRNINPRYVRHNLTFTVGIGIGLGARIQ
jgi:hypothetical protein